MSIHAIPSHLFIASESFEPAYLALHRSGELQRRAQAAVAQLAECHICPRNCRVNRLGDKQATCHTGRYARVASHFAHFGEEDCLRGWRGSGTIFFSFCNLRCCFCQNHATSHAGEGEIAPPERLARMMLELQRAGCHNINFVTPEHVVPQVLEALVLAVDGGLRLPIVYNTSAYDSLDSLRLLDGVVDIYMPDFKFWDARLSLQYMSAKDYPKVAKQVIAEMHRQVGPLRFDEHGLALRGVLVRHLVMPGQIAGTGAIMRYLGELSPDTYVNVMDQYYPAGSVSAEKYPEINRRITGPEFAGALDAARKAGLWRLDERIRRDASPRWQPDGRGSS